MSTGMKIDEEEYDKMFRNIVILGIILAFNVACIILVWITWGMALNKT